MGKTFKYGYAGHSFRSLERHAEAKVGDRRKVRRALKDCSRAEIDEMDYVTCNKFDPSRSGYCTGNPNTYLPNSTASWDKSNANIVWEENDTELIGNTGNHTIVFTKQPYYGTHTDNIAYNIASGSISKYHDLVGKKQLKRRNEIGKTSLLNRNDQYYDDMYCEDKN